MNIRFNVASGGRKAFARAVGGILGCDVVYNGTPSFAYTIGRYTVDREGALICPADMDCEEVNRLIGALHKRGYEAEEIPDYNTLQMTEREELWLGRERRDPIGEDRMQPSDVLDSDENRLVIEVPIADFPEYAYANLGNIVASKNRLIKKALGTDSLRIDIDDEKMAFPWFTLTGAEGEADAYLRFITALCKMAKEQKRVTAKERPLENDKFAMRYG